MRVSLPQLEDSNPVIANRVPGTGVFSAPEGFAQPHPGLTLPGTAVLMETDEEWQTEKRYLSM